MNLKLKFIEAGESCKTYDYLHAYALQVWACIQVDFEDEIKAQTFDICGDKARLYFYEIIDDDLTKHSEFFKLIHACPSITQDVILKGGENINDLITQDVVKELECLAKVNLVY